MPDFYAQNIVKEFETPGEPLRILDDVNLELDQGQNVAIIGPSGSGKSTFLHIAGTLDHATSGKVLLMEQDLAVLEGQDLAHFRNENVGFIFQEHHLLPQLSALENVLIPAAAQGKSSDAAYQRAKDLLSRVGLQERMTHRPGALSGGERQRVAIARALIQSPKLLLADEPTGSLDQTNAENVGKLLLDLQQEEQSILICVTHSAELAGRFQKQVRLDNGKFV
ncbi:MAG: ABC transporter ATP-binding protein [Planctomycetota bacterium]